jgi:hypothetical protein
MIVANWPPPSNCANATSHLAEIALRPNVLETRPLTRVGHAEPALRRWARGEPGPHIENAIGELRSGH